MSLGLIRRARTIVRATGLPVELASHCSLYPGRTRRERRPWRTGVCWGRLPKAVLAGACTGWHHLRCLLFCRAEMAFLASLDRLALLAPR